LVASNYAEATALSDSSDDEEEIHLKSKSKAVRAKKDFKSAPTEPVPKVPAKKPRGTIRDALLRVK
jgi:hypothetical protein